MKRMKKAVAMLLVLVMTGSLLSGCGSSKGKLITLTVYSQLANYSGEMQGWFATILEQKFNVKVNIVPDGDGVYDTRMESGDLGDIVVWGNDGADYIRAVEAGLLYDWEDDNLVQEYGPYIWEHMQAALEKNREVSRTGAIYGFGHNVARSSDSHDAFFYTWDIRWDLYEELGHPEVNDLYDLMDVLEQMQALSPTGDDGNKTYAMSIWPDWDGNYVMYVKAMATAYYGYDEFGFGHYNVETGEFYDALSEGSPYLEMLAWFNQLYRRGLLDPDSMTQKYDEMGAKVQNGNVLFSIFNYAGSLTFNNEKHSAENQIMLPLTPNEASPIVAGLSPLGGNRVWSIGAKTQYPELCMEIINWLCTPEGRLSMDYGPKGVCWDYDEEGRTYLTEFGKIAVEDKQTLMPDEWGGATFNDGSFQVNNTTWTAADINPESGEPYDRAYWLSEQVPEGRCDAERDWRAFTGSLTTQEYMDARGKFAVDVPTTYSESDKEPELENTWQQVATCLKDYSWRAIYATSDEEFEQIVSEMRGRAMSYGYQQCIEWCIQEANIKNALQEPLR
ncbi:MAG: extracellular solute-binding protein [Lachnospiraceae bacterium]|nr:extracellular solute-binding protein [Lachnospiraceae bacterium]